MEISPPPGWPAPAAQVAPPSDEDGEEPDLGGMTLEMSAPAELVPPAAITGDTVCTAPPSFEAPSFEAPSSDPPLVAPAPPAAPVAPESNEGALNAFFMAGAGLLTLSVGLGCVLILALPDQQLYGALALGMGVPVGLVLLALGIVARLWPPEA